MLISIFREFFKKNRAQVIFFIIIAFFSYPLETVFIPKYFSSLYENIAEKKNIQSLIFFIIIVLVIAQGSIYIINHLTSVLIPNFVSFIRKLLIEGLISKLETNYSDMSISKYITKIFELSRDLSNLTYNVLMVFIPFFLTIIVIFAYLFYINRNVGLIYLGFIILIGIIFLWLGKKSVNYAVLKTSSLYDFSSKMNDNLDNLMNIYLNNQVDNENKKMDKQNELSSSYQKKQFLFGSILILVSNLLTILLILTIFIFSNKLLKQKIISSQDFMKIAFILIFFYNGFNNFQKPLNLNLSYLGVYYSTLPFLKDIVRFDKQKKLGNNIINGDIKFKNIWFKYKDNYVFNNYSMEIKDKEKVVIMGKSGSGKTTLIKLLLKLKPIEKGEILINGKNINEIDHKEIRDKIVYINQRTTMFNGSVLYNIKYGNVITDEYIIELLKKYDLLDNFKNLNKGVYSDVGVQGKNLSGGMQKIIIILRGLLKQSNVYVFDEPLASLDEQSRQKVIKLIINELKDKTIIVITHDKEIVPHMGRVIKIS